MTIKPRIIGYRRNGCPIWAIQGGSEPAVEPGSNGTPPAGPTAQNEPGGDNPLGPAGEKALNTEREARKALEKELATLKAAQADLPKRLAEVFGGKPEDAKSTDDAVAEMQKQFVTLQHQLLVSTVARDEGITDADDLALLADTSGEEKMRALAKRIAPKADESQPPKKRAPGPDPNQGRGTPTDQPKGQAGAAEAARRFPKKQ